MPNEVVGAAIRSPAEDRIVPTDKARQILSAIPDNRKELVIIHNAVHDATYNVVPTLYMTTVLGFLERSVKITDPLPD